MTNKQGTDNSVGETVKKYKHMHKVFVAISLSGIILGIGLELSGISVFADDSNMLLRFLVQGLVFLPLLASVVGRMWMQGDITYEHAIADAANVDPNATARKPISLGSPAVLKVRSILADTLPFMVLAVVIMLFVGFGGIAMEAIVSSGAPFETLTAVFIGFGVFVFAALIWCIVVGIRKERVLKAVRSDVTDALTLHGYSWAKKDFPFVPGNNQYTEASPAILRDNKSYRLSFWTVEWNGDHGVFTPVDAPVTKR